MLLQITITSTDKLFSMRNSNTMGKCVATKSLPIIQADFYDSGVQSSTSVSVNKASSQKT